jgi:hypothetical protein
MFFLILSFVELALLIILIKKILGFLGEWLSYCQNTEKTENTKIAQRSFFSRVGKNILPGGYRYYFQ